MKVVVRVIMVSLLSHCEINFSCFIEALDSKGILRTLKKVLGTFRSEDEDDYENEFSVLSTRTSKKVGLQALCACSVRKTRTRSRPRPPI